MSRQLVESLHNYISTLPVIDCHEHTFLPAACPQPTDLWTILRNSDVGDDLISAGMPASSRAGLNWAEVEPFLPKVRNTGFYRSLLLAFRHLFDFPDEDITASNWQSLSEQIQTANAQPDWYEEVLRRRADIQLILRVQGDEADPYALERNLFGPLIKFDEWILTTAPAECEGLAQKFGGSARTLSAYLEALEAAFRHAKTHGAVGAKSMLAYQRTLDIGRPTFPLFKLMVDLGWVNTYWALLVPAAAWPYNVFLMRQVIYSLPYEILDAGRIDGCNEFSLFWRIVLPMSTNGIAVMGIFSFVQTWNDFLWPLIILNSEDMRTLPIALATFQSTYETDYGLLMAGGVIMAVPMFMMFFLFQRYFLQGVTFGAVKG